MCRLVLAHQRVRRVARHATLVVLVTGHQDVPVHAPLFAPAVPHNPIRCAPGLNRECLLLRGMLLARKAKAKASPPEEGTILFGTFKSLSRDKSLYLLANDK